MTKHRPITTTTVAATHSTGVQKHAADWTDKNLASNPSLGPEGIRFNTSISPPPPLPSIPAPRGAEQPSQGAKRRARGQRLIPETECSLGDSRARRRACTRTHLMQERGRRKRWEDRGRDEEERKETEVMRETERKKKQKELKKRNEKERREIGRAHV